MDKSKVNFNISTATLKVVDQLAADDHRDRTSMINKIIDTYLTQHTDYKTYLTQPSKKTGK